MSRKILKEGEVWLILKPCGNCFMEEKLWRIILFLQRTEIGSCLVKLLYASNVISIYNWFVLEYERRHPTQQMRDAKFFWRGENKRRKEKCRCLLYDEKSREIYDTIISFRISHNYRKRPVYSRSDQYFPKDIIVLENNEVFVDCGAYNGDTVKQFIKQTKNKYKRIIAFEPDHKNINSLKKVSGNIVIVDAAVWSCDTTKSFKYGNGSGSHINNNVFLEHDLVKTKAIDNVKECENASFIKMDIEGSEYDALLGAYQTSYFAD